MINNIALTLPEDKNYFFLEKNFFVRNLYYTTLLAQLKEKSKATLIAIAPLNYGK